MTRNSFRFFAGLMKAQRGKFRRARDWRECCLSMAEHCAEGNARFDRVRFLTACGLELDPAAAELSAIIDRVTAKARRDSRRYGLGAQPRLSR